MRMLTVVGARPQFVKAAVVSHAVAKYNIDEFIVHTGQHYDYEMSEGFFNDLNIPTPKYNLGVGSASHGAQTGRMIEAIEKIIIEDRPDIVTVYGDTNSTLAGAIAAVKLNIPIAHVESGLRSFNRIMPEEINRLLTDQVSDILFAPTDIAVNNLISEGIHAKKIELVGDVMYDAAVNFFENERADELLARLGVVPKDYILATIHRAENTDNKDRLKAIVQSLVRASKDRIVLFPMHPRTISAIKGIGMYDQIEKSLVCLPPLAYLDMLSLEKNASVIITDSGGVQKEAFFARVPCLILRDETEWVELVDIGAARLTTPELLCDFINGIEFAVSDSVASDLYGGGYAAEKIARKIFDVLS